MTETRVERRALDREILRLAWPALGALAADPLVSLVDTAWVGRLGADELAVLGVATTILVSFFFIFNFLAYGATPLIGAALGRGDPEAAARIGGAATVVAVAAGVVGMAAAIALAPALVAVMGADNTIASATVDYLRIRALAMPAVLLIIVAHGIFRGHQDTRTPFTVTVGFNVVNLILDPALIFGLDWGINGAAIATVIAQWIGVIWFIALSRRREHASRLLRFSGLTWQLARPLMGASAALVIRTGSLLAVFAVATGVATRIGNTAVAAHQVASQLWLFLALVVDSLAIAGQAMIGPRLASGRQTGARAVADRLLQMGLVVGLALAALMAALMPVLPRLFTDDPVVLEAVQSVYWFVVVMQPLNALVFVWDGVGIGASAFRYLAASMVGAAAVTLGLLFSILPLGGGLVMVWWSLTVLMAVRLALMGWWHVAGPLGTGRLS
ncbi:MAG: MATE family efflux transporter [Acidimicrobiia bacterium]|nr:MATE family efflux transporter [Acidimicrobiia bacterium]